MIRPHLACTGPKTSRRSFMKIGGFSLGALAGGASLHLDQALAAEAASPGADRDFSVILLWAAGGPSHLETFDLKPDAPSEYRGDFKPIRTNVPGIDICELMPRLAQRADKYTLLRSLHHNRNEHSGGTARMLSGYASVAANPFQSEFPVIGSLVAKHLESQTRDLPLYVGNSNFYGGGPAYLGPAYVPFMFRGDPSNPSYSVGDLTITQAAALQLQRRTELLGRFDTFRRDVDRSETMSALDRFNQRAVEMLTSERTRQAFDISKEPAHVRDSYGRTTGGQSLLMARRLVEAGVRFVEITAHNPVSAASGVVGATNWDDHSVNANIFSAYRDRMPTFDRSLSALIDDLHYRGLNEKVLVVFCGEFGRTPRISNAAAGKGPGRDHWCRSMSVLVSGGGLKMGQVIGTTNSRGEEPAERIMNSNCLLATIYRRFGIDTAHANIDRTGRPIPILTEGSPIPELF